MDKIDCGNVHIEMSLLTKVVWIKRPILTKMVIRPSPKMTVSPAFFRLEFTLSSFNNGKG